MGLNKSLAVLPSPDFTETDSGPHDGAAGSFEKDDFDH
jgi:hypothetical protein